MHRGYRNFIGIIGASLIITGLSSQLKAETITPTATITPTKAGEIIITATRSEQKVIKVPANVTIITEEDIRGSNAQSIPEILKSEDGLMVRDWTGSGKAVSVDIRGFGETGDMNTLVLVDGRRVTQIDLSGTDWLQIPLEDVSRIEIIRGAGSVLYGDNAAGGVINIITKKGQIDGFKGEVKTLFGSYDLKDYSLNAQGGNNDLYFSMNQTNRNTNGFRKNSYLDSTDSNLCLGILPNPNLNVELSSGKHHDSFGLPGFLTKSDIANFGRRATNNPDDNASTDDSYYKLRIDNQTESAGRFSFDISARSRGSHSKWVSSQLNGDDQIDSLYFSPKYILEHNSANLSFRFTGGLDVLGDTDLIKRDSYNPFWTYTDNVTEKKDSTGVYGLGELGFLNSFNLSAGYRCERARYVFDGTTVNQTMATTTPWDEKKVHTDYVFSSGLSYLYKSDSSVYVNYEQLFRCPAIDEYFDTFSGLNAQLRPQDGNQNEAGIKHTFPNLGFINVAVFKIETENEIFYNPATYKNENYDRINRSGLETKLGWQRYAVLNYAYTKAVFYKGSYKGNDVPDVPRHKGSVIVTVPVTVKNIDAQVCYNYVGRRYLISDEGNTQPFMKAYGTTDVTVSYGYKNLKASFGVNNLFNQKYEEYGVYSAFSSKIGLYPSPERNYIFGVALEF